MEAILVIDEMPTRCIDCPCYYEDKGRCQNTWESVEDDFARPSWCPLKPMPTKKKPLFDPDHCEIEKEIKIVHEIVGYNRCIDEILGETKNETVKSAG